MIETKSMLLSPKGLNYISLVHSRGIRNDAKTLTHVGEGEYNARKK
jgi:hypothetical protein